MEEIQSKEINLRVVIVKILKNKKTFLTNCLVAGVLASLIILCVPRYYRCEISLAPETTSISMGGGSLSSIASSLGINLGEGMSGDAIYPALYPDLMESTDFLVTLLPILVETEDGSIRTTFQDYLKNNQKSPWWSKTIRSVKKLFKKKKKGFSGSSDGSVDPFHMSEAEFEILEGVKNSINCSVDTKTEVISLAVKAQDPLVCATVADSIRVKLQNFITSYRTSKARVDCAYYEKITEDAKHEYELAMRRYSVYCDAHKNVIMQSYVTEQEKLENEMSLKFNEYQMNQTQLQMAKAKVQEKTPAFTVLQSASVPVKPAGPKRMIFVALIILLTFTFTLFYELRDNILKQYQ